MSNRDTKGSIICVSDKKRGVSCPLWFSVDPLGILRYNCGININAPCWGFCELLIKKGRWCLATHRPFERLRGQFGRWPLSYFYIILYRIKKRKEKNCNFFYCVPLKIGNMFSALSRVLLILQVTSKIQEFHSCQIFSNCCILPPQSSTAILIHFFCNDSLKAMSQ